MKTNPDNAIDNILKYYLNYDAISKYYSSFRWPEVNFALQFYHI